MHCSLSVGELGQSARPAPALCTQAVDNRMTLMEPRELDTRRCGAPLAKVIGDISALPCGSRLDTYCVHFGVQPVDGENEERCELCNRPASSTRYPGPGLHTCEQCGRRVCGACSNYGNRICDCCVDHVPDDTETFSLTSLDSRQVQSAVRHADGQFEDAAQLEILAFLFILGALQQIRV